MCGIAGLVNLGSREALTTMTSVQAHRGPDDHGTWDHRYPDGTYVGLGSRRLSILDLSPAGHMPMSNADGTAWIVYNGEVYNFKELRADLEARGERFSSGTDTEVVLRLYEREGPGCVKRLRGMFAFAIADLRNESLFLARDPFGIKPLYYTNRDGGLAFASEMKALVRSGQIVPRIDEHALHQYLTFLWVPEPQTIIQGVSKLPAGHTATYRRGSLTVEQYWDLEFPDRQLSFERSEEDLAAELREHLNRSVREQLVSDRPVGAFLSAGLDSSAIVATMAAATDQPVRTYTITYPENYRVGETTLDDPSVARRTAERFGCDHHEMVVEPEVAQLLPKLVWHMDEPVADPAIVASYLVCEQAKNDATVLLSGVGGDELFAGYRKHVAHMLAGPYRKLPGPLRRHVIEPAIGALPSFRGTPAKGMVRLAKKMARSASMSPRDAFLMNATYLNADEKSALYTDDLAERMKAVDPWDRHRGYFDVVGHADFLNQMLYVDVKTFMVSLNLNYTDKTSMAASIEARVPFLDQAFAEFSAREVPPALKAKGGPTPTTKHLLRVAMRDILPAEVIAQPKAGFAAPVDYWLANELQEMASDLTSEQRVKSRGLFRYDTVGKMAQEHRTGRRDWSMQIWQLVTLELWMQAFVDG